jgi:hypothetical protein
MQFPSFKPPLNRNLKHILDFGLYPKACEISPSFHHYQATYIIGLNACSELACTFDLPSHCAKLVKCEGPALLSKLFPLKLRSKPLQDVLESLAGCKPVSAISILLPPVVPSGLLSTVAQKFATLATTLVKLDIINPPF